MSSSFEVLTDEELARCAGSLSSADISIRPMHVVSRLTGIGMCGCGSAHD